MPKIVRGRRTRLPTEVPGLDSVLGGGALRGGIYVVRGAPGSGKTIPTRGAADDLPTSPSSRNRTRG